LQAPDLLVKNDVGTRNFLSASSHQGDTAWLTNKRPEGLTFPSGISEFQWASGGLPFSTGTSTLANGLTPLRLIWYSQTVTPHHEQ